MSHHTTTRAIVASSPDTTASAPKEKWSFSTIHLPSDLGPDELLIEIVASGICHTDIIFTQIPSGNPFGVEYPKVVGHEGSGYVRAKGSAVTKVDVGDPVLLSYAFCGSCKCCREGTPGFCTDFDALNFAGKERYMSKQGVKEDVYGQFFGQSSFANFSIVKAASVLNAKDLVKSEEELRLFAPLGCGLQTGSGAVFNAADAREKDTVVVTGLGGVGCAAIMAAKIRGCKTIIGIDRIASRGTLAKSLGATHYIDTNEVPLDKLVDKIRELTDGDGADVMVDTTGAKPILDKALELTCRGGRFVFVGSAAPDYHFDFAAFQFMTGGRKLIACVEGNKAPEKQIPDLIKYYREGKFPFDKLVKFSKAEDWEHALHTMHTGDVIKPILTW